MREDSDFILFCVGDDWQSIYRFTGCDISYIINFEKYWGLSMISKIETTYRFNQNLIQISSNFIMENPAQIKKNIIAVNKSEELAFEVTMSANSQYGSDQLTKTLSVLPKGSRVYLLGRYNTDIEFLKNIKDIIIKRDYRNKTYSIFLKRRDDLEIKFMTIHKSKGLQADYVFILNNMNKVKGFPSKIIEPPIFSLLLEDFDKYLYSEERRLFYVALTRAKTKVWLITSKDDISEFANETIKFASGLSVNICPKCGGSLLKREGPYGKFWGCSNYSSAGCKYIKQISQNPR
jgi:DNA helicase-4